MNFSLLLLVVAVVVVAESADERPKTECQKHRDSAEKIGTIMKLIPECDDNGDYKPLQCYIDSKFCVCYDKKGHPSSPISPKIKECGCYLARKEKSSRGHENPYLPQCEEDGKWAKKQCYNDGCWCVDKDGNRGDNPIRHKENNVTCE